MLRRSNYFCLPALFFLLLSLVLIVLIYQAGSRNLTLKLEVSDVVLADAESDHEKAINRYQLLDRDNPLIKVRIMRRRWLLALSIFQQSKKSEGVELGQNEITGNLSKEFDDLLFAMQQSGASLLNQGGVPAVVWRVHNLLGASFLLQALATLKRGQDLKRSQACLSLAIDHFKQTIAWVDRDPEAHDMSNIPRWNMELLSTRKNLFKLVTNRVGVDSKLDLKKNLATMLPESAGYMFGEPPDSRIRK